MLRVVCVILAGGVAVAAASPNGRVVRVERKRDATIPRLCGITSATQAICLGEPMLDERIVLIDQRGGQVVGELRIDGIREATDLDMCTREPPPLYKVHGTLLAGDPAVIDAGNPMGLRGAVLRSRPRVISRQRSPSGVETEKVEIAIDTTDDGNADLVITQYTCGRTSAGVSDTVCIDTYVRRSDRLSRVRQDVLHRCL